MATFNSSLYTKQSQGKAPLASPAGFGKIVHRAFASVALTSAYATNDLLNFFTLPAGAKIVDVWLYSTDIDTNGSPVATIDVGDADGAATIYSASTAGEASGYDRSPLITAIDKMYSVDTLIQGKIHLQGATRAAGTVYLTVFYTLDGLPTS